MALTGENFIRINRTSKANELQEKIIELQNERAELQNINIIREYGFDEEKHEQLTKRIERLEYLKYCCEYEDNRKRNWG